MLLSPGVSRSFGTHVEELSLLVEVVSQDIVPTFLPHLWTTFAWPSGRQKEGDWCKWERPGAILWP